MGRAGPDRMGFLPSQVHIQKVVGTNRRIDTLTSVNGYLIIEDPR